FTVKDLVNTKGVRTTFGAVPCKDNVPDHDAVAVARLRGQGGILVGKTTTPEFGTKCLTDSPLFGRTRNAWSAARSSGGSSGGRGCLRSLVDRTCRAGCCRRGGAARRSARAADFVLPGAFRSPRRRRCRRSVSRRSRQVGGAWRRAGGDVWRRLRRGADLARR